MKARGITAAELARETGLKRQQVYNLIGHESSQADTRVGDCKFQTIASLLEALHPDLQLEDVDPDTPFRLVGRGVGI